jgi:ectoine hydroxylase-related dioxygenase (phytanoyl-CoA dioxygenase family)
VDVPPTDRQYAVIAAVALTEWTADNGAVIAFDPRPRAVELSPGEIIAFAPSLSHSPGLNRTGLPRIGVYFRWLLAP